MWKKIDEWAGREVYSCLSTDTKLTGVTQGSICLETDTGNSYELNGTWVQTVTDGAAHVSTSGSPGSLETRDFYFVAANTTDIDANGDAAVVPAKLCIGGGFGSGKQRARLTLHGIDTTAGTDGVIRATLNAGDAANAASRLSVLGGVVNEVNVDAKYGRAVSEYSPIAEWRLSGTDQVDDIYMSMVSMGTAYTSMFCTVEVW